jgi:protein O-GlcNAc transferase
MSTADLLAAAVAHHRAGRLDQAAALYDSILASSPDNAEALHNSGLIALRRGDTGEAIGKLQRAAAAAPDRAVTQNDLGAALRFAGRLPEAAASLEKAVAIDPNYADAWNNLGIVRRGVDDLAGARAALERAAELKADFAPTFNALGVVLRSLSESDAAVVAFRKALAIKPDYPEALTNCGLALLEMRRPAEALALLDRAANLTPTVAEAWLNLGLAQRARGDLVAAADALRRATSLNPKLAAAWNAFGVICAALTRHEAACEALAHAVRLAPNSPEFLSNYGLALQKAGRDEEALKALERALVLQPSHAEALFNRGVVRQSIGDFSGALADWRATLSADPSQRVARSNLLFALQYEADVSGPALLAEARAFERWHSRPGDRYRSWPNQAEPGRRLRVGYVSPDFRTHPVAQYVEPLFKAHAFDAVELFAYAYVTRPDDVTRRLQGLVPNWRFIDAGDAAAVARQIRDDGIDILIDLAGHTADNQLAVFALKPAPIQVTWLGYPGTTGLSAIDYRLTDEIADPPGTDDPSSESPVRLPHGFHCWRPPMLELPLSRRDAKAAPVFGSFNNVQKMSPATFELWSEILRRAPDARLVLKSYWLSRPGVAERIRRSFEQLGVAPERLSLSGFIPDTAAHLHAYAEIDVALDPCPYNGTTTTLEALWMGVPVVTLRGERHAARVGASLLTHAGMGELIASNPGEYVAVAAALAADGGRLTEFRAAARQRLQASPLLDVPRFARALEAAYRTMWQRWCEAGVRAGA